MSEKDIRVDELRKLIAVFKECWSGCRIKAQRVAYTNAIVILKDRIKKLEEEGKQ